MTREQIWKNCRICGKKLKYPDETFSFDDLVECEECYRGDSVSRIKNKLIEARERSFLKRGTRWPDKWSRGYKLGDND